MNAEINDMKNLILKKKLIGEVNDIKNVCHVPNKIQRILSV